MNLGLKPQVIGPALSVILAQRLVRRLCPHCRETVLIGDELKANIAKFLARLPERIDRSKYENISLFKPVGCDKCADGYKGRVGLYEIMEMGPDFERIIHADASESEISDLARSKGFVTMQEDGILKSLLGNTDFAEVERITGPIVW